jgi:hypothetical protein
MGSVDKMKNKKSLPYGFVFEHLAATEPYTKPMFGHTAVYVGEKIVLFLIDQPGNPDNGICLATSAEHIPSLCRSIASLKHLEAYGPEATNWRLIPSSSPDFEEDALRACEMILSGDIRIGRVPKGRKKIKKRS